MGGPSRPLSSGGFEPTSGPPDADGVVGKEGNPAGHVGLRARARVWPGGKGVGWVWGMEPLWKENEEKRPYWNSFLIFTKGSLDNSTKKLEI